MLLALCSRLYCGHPGKTGHFHPSIHQHKTEKGIGKVGPCLTEHQEREMRGNKSNKTERLNLKMSNYLYPRRRGYESKKRKVFNILQQGKLQRLPMPSRAITSYMKHEICQFISSPIPFTLSRWINYNILLIAFLIGLHLGEKHHHLAS